MRWRFQLPKQPTSDIKHKMAGTLLTRDLEASDYEKGDTARSSRCACNAYAIRRAQYFTGYLELLSQLTTVGSISEEDFQSKLPSSNTGHGPLPMRST